MRVKTFTKYAKQMRESDKVVINLIREAVSDLSGAARRLVCGAAARRGAG